MYTHFFIATFFPFLAHRAPQPATAAMHFKLKFNEKIFFELDDYQQGIKIVQKHAIKVAELKKGVRKCHA